MTLFPQILLNVPVAQPILAAKLPEVLKKEKELKSRLGRHGRVLLRPSGTERVARVMGEGEREDLIKEMAQVVAATS
jgi:phosphoglucosamine mutase